MTVECCEEALFYLFFNFLFTFYFCFAVQTINSVVTVFKSISHFLCGFLIGISSQNHKAHKNWDILTQLSKSIIFLVVIHR